MCSERSAGVSSKSSQSWVLWPHEETFHFPHHFNGCWLLLAAAEWCESWYTRNVAVTTATWQPWMPALSTSNNPTTIIFTYCILNIIIYWNLHTFLQYWSIKCHSRISLSRIHRTIYCRLVFSNRNRLHSIQYALASPNLENRQQQCRQQKGEIKNNMENWSAHNFVTLDFLILWPNAKSYQQF